MSALVVARSGSGPSARVIEARAVGNAPGSIKVVLGTDQSYLLASHVERPAEGDTYELWWSGADGRPIPAETFRPDDAGNAVVTLGPPPADTRHMAVTIEPGGRHDAPMGRAVATADV